MSKNTNETIAGSVIAVLAPLCVGLAADWPFWVTALITAGAFIGTQLVLRGWHHRREQAHLRSAAEYRRQMAAQQVPPPPEPTPPPSRSVSSVSLPSTLDGIPFTFGCTVHWRSNRSPLDNGHADPAAIAVDAVLARARQISRGHHPDDDTVVHALSASLGHSDATSDRLLVTWATDVTVQVGQEHREHLQDLAALRRQQNLQEQRIANQRMLRTYLGDEVLTSVGSTVVWWLARDEGQVRETVDLIGTLAQLSAAATNSEVDDLFRHLVSEQLPEPVNPPGWFSPATADAVGPSFVDVGEGVAEPMTEPPTKQSDLLPDPEDAANSLFGHQFADLAERHGHSELAQQVRERYRTIDVAEPAQGPMPPDFFEGDLGPSASGPEDGEVPPSAPEPPDEPEGRRDWGAGG